MKNKFSLILTVLSLLLSSSAILSAQNNADYTYTAKQDSVELSAEIDEVKVTAFRTPHNLKNIPAPVNLITSAQLERGSALTPAEALNQLPGVIMHHGTLTTNRLTIRGIGSRTPYATNKLKVYFGEIPLTSGDGETALEDIENTSIQRIEVIKGPSSSLYGAGLAGTIFFHPKNVTNDFVNYQSTFASFNTFKNTIQAGIRQNKLNLFVLGSVLNSRGFRENNATNRLNLTFQGRYSFSKKTELYTLVKLTKLKAFIPSSMDLDTFLESPHKAAENWKGIKGYEAYTRGQFGLSLKTEPGKFSKISASVFGSLRDADEPRPFNLLLEDSHYTGFRANYQKTFKNELIETTLISGLELFAETYNWSTHTNADPRETISDNREKRSYENLFIQAEMNVNNKLFLSSGINGNLTRFNYIDNFPYDGDKSGKRNYKPVVSPRIGANYQISYNLSMFGNISHGFSTPSFDETLLPEGQINPEIKPESGWNFEAGIRADFNQNLLASVSYYRIYIKNLLVARRTGDDEYVGVNAGKSLHPGVETELKWIVTNPGHYPSLILSGNATIANYHFQDFLDEDSDFSGNLLPGTSRTTWLASADFKPVKNIEFYFWHRFTGKMPANDANTVFSKSYGISNLEIKYSGQTNKLKFEIKTGVQNIFDVHYASMLAVNILPAGNMSPRYFYPGNPRNYFVAIQIGLH